MKKYSVHISADAYYPYIEADSKEQAIAMAMEWFLYYEPEVKCEEEEAERVAFDPVPSSPEGQFRIGEEFVDDEV